MDIRDKNPLFPHSAKETEVEFTVRQIDIAAIIEIRR